MEKTITGQGPCMVPRIRLLISKDCTLQFILRTLKTHHHNFAIFSQTVNMIGKLPAAFNVQLIIGMDQTLI